MSELLNIVASVAMALGLAGVVLCGATFFALRRVLRRPARRPWLRPAISVLKPLKGLEPELYANLASLAQQAYPRFELILGAADPADPALAIARRLRRDFPRVPITIIAGYEPLGCNPKVEALANLESCARFEWLLISDANVRARPDYLEALASELEAGEVGLVANVLVGTGADTLGAKLESLHLNTFIAGAVCGAQLFRHPCVVGKSMLFKRRDLGRLGGWSLVQDVLAEDYLLGQRFDKAGCKVALSAHVLATVNSGRSVRDFINRHMRWHQMRRWISPSAYAAEILLTPSVFLALASVAATFGGSALTLTRQQTVALAMSGVLAKIGLDAASLRRLSKGGPVLSQIAVSPIRDALILGIWVASAVRRTLEWHGHLMRIGPGSVLTGVTRTRARRAA